MVVREQTLVTLTVEEIRNNLPFPMLGLDVETGYGLSHLPAVDVGGK